MIESVKSVTTVVAVVAALLPLTAGAVDKAYAQKLERSGCTQATELQGCDINKTKAENAKAGFGAAAAPAVPAAPAAASSPYTGQWVAKSAQGRTVATIRIDGTERVWVDGKRVQAKRSDGALVFKSGMITFTMQGDRRLKGEDTWRDADAGTTGPIVPE